MALFSRKTGQPPHQYRTAIVDIGSNSVRLVVYAGPRRNPAVIFNEKVMAGLGQSLADTGTLLPDAMGRALQALARFRLLIREMDVDEVICVATAAVRDASNGQDFSEQVRAIGFDLAILSGEDEAEAAALGVLSGIPDADGIVGDLGGGSLDLARVANGEVFEKATLPLGVLRVAAMRRDGGMAFSRTVKAMLKPYPWLSRYPGKPFYLVGGSWRAAARFDMHLTGYPLRVLHQYEMGPTRPKRLSVRLATLDKDALRSISGLASSRISTLDDAVALLRIMASVMKPSRFILSSYGLREGLLFRELSPEIRKCDPLMVAVERFGESQSRFGESADSLHAWIAAVFAADPPEWRRWRLAACHLADVAWQTNPDFRAERGLEIALHGNWVGVDGIGREMIGQALFTNFGGGPRPFSTERHLASPEMLERAIAWGLAIRLAQRLGAGTHGLLERCSLRIADGTLVLGLLKADFALSGEVVERRLRRLAQTLGLGWRIEVQS